MRPVAKGANGLNKTEQRMANDLAALKAAGKIIDWRAHPVKLELAGFKCAYTPDFFVVHPDYFEVIEVKGFLRDDALVKFKVAAERYWWWTWRMVAWEKRNWQLLYEINAKSKE